MLFLQQVSTLLSSIELIKYISIASASSDPRKLRDYRHTD